MALTRASQLCSSNYCWRDWFTSFPLGFLNCRLLPGLIWLFGSRPRLNVTSVLRATDLSKVDRYKIAPLTFVLCVVQWELEERLPHAGNGPCSLRCLFIVVKSVPGQMFHLFLTESSHLRVSSSKVLCLAACLFALYNIAESSLYNSLMRRRA